MKISRRTATNLVAALVAMCLVFPVQGASAATITPASAVRSVSAIDAWDETRPQYPRVNLSWGRPLKTYGASITGYRIEVSTDNRKWRFLVSNTKSTTTSAIVDKGFSAGIPLYFRVRAITNKGSSSKVGNPSTAVKRTLTAAPQPPALLGLTKRSFTTTTHTARWLPQSDSKKGSSTTSYEVTATAESGAVVNCATSDNYCELSGLQPGVTYSISLTAKNSRGSSTNLDKFEAQDADLAIQWYLDDGAGISAASAWTVTRGSPSVVVAVLDSGITDHPDLEGQLVKGYDFVSDVSISGDGDGLDSDPTDPGDSGDSSSHGTHVAGIIGAKSDSIGISGVAPNVKIQPIRVLGTDGEGNSSDLALAIRWAAGQNVNGLIFDGVILKNIPVNKTPAKVINMSMAFQPRAGSKEFAPCPYSVQAAVDYAQSKGVTLVAAAGNGDTALNPVANSRVYPTNCRGPLSVGATGYSGDVAFYSNFGVDLVAPGGDQRSSVGAPAGSRGMIYSTSNANDTGYDLEQGTSQAAPIAAGIIALMYSLRPDIDITIVWKALQASAQPFPQWSSCALDSRRCGIGRINAAAALEALIAITG